jgi:hypothetical protein
VTRGQVTRGRVSSGPVTGDRVKRDRETYKKQKPFKGLSRKIKWMIANVVKAKQCTTVLMKSAQKRNSGLTTALIVLKKVNFMFISQYA